MVAVIGYGMNVQQHLETSYDAMQEALNASAQAAARDYDFQVVDDMAHWQVRFWKWCKREEAERLGVQVQAPTESYQGHNRIEISADTRSVEALLSNDKTRAKLNKADMDNLLWKLLRSECHFMAKPDNSSVILMVETVRLRCVNDGKILIQEESESLIHTRAGLPSLEKLGNQSPAGAAQHLWSALLKMPADMADFIEDTVDDIEFEGYRGLRCVERVHVMAVKMRTEDPAIIDKIGLPSHTDFCIKDQSEAESGKNVERKFKWMTFKQFLKIGGVLSNMNADVRGKSLVDGPSAAQNLVDFLRQGGIDPDTWDSKGDGRLLQLLLNELKKGKCYLEMNSKGLMRVVDIVSIRVWSPDRKHLLVDKGRQNKYGDQEWNAQLPGRKKDKVEQLQEVALAMCGTVNLKEEDITFPDEVSWEYFDYTDESHRFPGLVTKYQKFFVDAVLEDEEQLCQRMHLPEHAHMNTLSSDEESEDFPTKVESGMQSIGTVVSSATHALTTWAGAVVFDDEPDRGAAANDAARTMIKIPVTPPGGVSSQRLAQRRGTPASVPTTPQASVGLNMLSVDAELSQNEDSSVESEAKPCGSRCGFKVTGDNQAEHQGYCCRRCKDHPGTHGPNCEKRRMPTDPVTADTVTGESLSKRRGTGTGAPTSPKGGKPALLRGNSASVENSEGRRF